MANSSIHKTDQSNAKRTNYNCFDGIKNAILAWLLKRRPQLLPTAIKLPRFRLFVRLLKSYQGNPPSNSSTHLQLPWPPLMGWTHNTLSHNFCRGVEIDIFHMQLVILAFFGRRDKVPYMNIAIRIQGICTYNFENIGKRTWWAWYYGRARLRWRGYGVVESADSGVVIIITW